MDLTFTTEQAEPSMLLRDGLLDRTSTYRVGFLCNGHAVYVLFKPCRVFRRHLSRERDGHEALCCLCQQVLRTDEYLTAVCTTDTAALFPPCFVHTACVDGHYRFVVRRLVVSWRAAKEYACWFPRRMA